MNRQIENIRNTRKYIIEQIRELSLEKLNIIPHSFNNNILWNMGHLVAAQQSICYTKGSLSPALAERTYTNYKPGTRPEKFYDSMEEDEIKEMLISSIDQMHKDYQENIFKSFVPWTNRYGNKLNDIDEAIAYLQFHEGLHTGVILSMKKLVQK